jgi:hypothetical protein
MKSQTKTPVWLANQKKAVKILSGTKNGSTPTNPAVATAIATHNLIFWVQTTWQQSPALN